MTSFSTPKKWLIYKITCRKNQKSYIGVTERSAKERFDAHLSCARNNPKFRFHYALRKHGAENFTVEVLKYDIKTLSEAMEWEKFYIKLFRTTKNKRGYNATMGGTGGWMIDRMSPKDKERYYKRRKELSTGENNGRYSGYTDDDIVSRAIEYYLNNGNIFVVYEWKELCKKEGLPIRYSSFRFSGRGIIGLYEAMKDRMGVERLNVPGNKISKKKYALMKQNEGVFQWD
jgi:hypothetical protein